MFRTLGHRTRGAGSAAEALELAAALRPDLFLIDLGMPGMNGYDLARRLRTDPACAGAALVAMTGYGQPEYRAAAESAGFDRHLVKPFDAAALADLLEDRESPADGTPGRFDGSANERK